MINAGFAREFIGVETGGRNSLSLLHKKDMMEILRKHVFLACNKAVKFHRGHWMGTSCHPANPKRYENVEVVTVQQVMSSGNPRVYWNDKESDGLWTPVGLVQVYSNQMASKMKHRAFMMFQGMQCC